MLDSFAEAKNLVFIGEIVGPTRTILIIDNDPLVLEAVEAFLNNHDYSVIRAQRWTEAIRELTDSDPDAVLLDLHLPTVRGEALLEFIRENHADLPVVIISEGATPDEMARLDKLGASGFIRKPFDTEDLIVILEQVLIDLEAVPAVVSETLPEPEFVPAAIEDHSDTDTEEDEESVSSILKRQRTQLMPGISPGSGARESAPLSTISQQPDGRHRRKKKRKTVRKTTLLKKVRNGVIILLLFLGMSYGIYLSQKSLDGNFIGGITFSRQSDK